MDPWTIKEWIEHLNKNLGGIKIGPTGTRDLLHLLKGYAPGSTETDDELCRSYEVIVKQMKKRGLAVG